MAQIIETATGAIEKGRRRPGHPRPHRERPAQRPLRDGRGAVPHGAVAGHPRAARRVPADRRPRREDGRRPVRAVHPRLPRRLRRHHRGGRRPADLGPLRLRRGDQPRQRLAGRRPDLPRGPGRRLGVDVRAHVRRRRQDAVVDAHRRAHDLRGGRGHPALQALRARASSNEDALRIILNQVRKPDWNRADLNGLVAACRTASPPGGRDVRPVRHRAPTSRRSTRCCSATTTP